MFRVSRPLLPAPWAAENWPETAFWPSPGHGRILLIWMGFMPFWTVGGVLTAKLHPFLSQHRASTATHDGARGPEAAATEDHLNVERGQGKMVRAAVGGREGGGRCLEGSSTTRCFCVLLGVRSAIH